jgi:hypothetical protein
MLRGAARNHGKYALTSPKGLNAIDLFGRFGAGEAIRTPDPNLGKVVLYP